MLRQLAVRREALFAMLGLATAWQIASLFFPSYLFPPLPAIGAAFAKIFGSWEQVGNALATALRILAGLAGAFLLGVVFAVAMAKSRKANDYLFPILHFNQGIPALSWVVISIIWFKSIEFRIWFIMVVTTVPAFAFQILDAYRSISKDLHEMALSFRPSRYDMFRTVVLPTVVPGILTAFKVNLGNASRVVVVAELVGATGGVGYQLLQMQQLFDLAGALAWTLVLVLFVLGTQQILTLLESRLLRYRAQSERGL
ncbi:MAG: ABC transporter permease subunit [Burkholderiales bacterium]|nr:ABC transporter permease subunit [Burkholderiales bacterium]